MITKITGKISRIGIQTIYIDTGCIEYEIYVPLNVIDQIQKKNSKKVEIYIYHYFQGEEQKLFGFLDFSQRELFKTIIQLKGIGPSLALSILSHLDLIQLIEVCEKKDIQRLLKIPRIGKNVAEELIFEVNRKKKKFLKLLEFSSLKNKVGEINHYNNEEMFDEVITGLKSLGYKEKQIKETIKKVEKKLTYLPQSTSEWVKEVLKEI